MFIIKIILCIVFIIISGALVWNSLRKKYVNAIFEKIQSAEEQLSGLWMHFACVSRNGSDNKVELRHHEEAYNILKVLTEEISEVDPRIIEYLMTDDEEKKYYGIFERLKKEEKELNRTKIQEEILSAPEFEGYRIGLMMFYVRNGLTLDDIADIKRDPKNSKARDIFNPKSAKSSCSNV